MPSNLLRPYIAQVHRYTLEHVKHYESVQEISENLSLFGTLLQEIILAIKIMHGANDHDKFGLFIKVFKKFKFKLSYSKYLKC